MFKRIARALMPRAAESKRESKKSTKCKQESKQESKRNYIPTTEEGDRNFTQTSKSERNQMVDLYRMGHSINVIADKFHRSTRTVHQVLTGRGSHLLPERDGPLQDADDDDDSEGSRQHSRRRSTRTNPVNNKVEARDSIFKQVEPMLKEMTVQHIKDNPEFALQVAASLLDIKLPKPSLDDIAMGIIKEDPDCRRQLAENYMERLHRNGRSEMDIFAEGLKIMLSASEFIHKPTSLPDVLSEAFRTGELRKIMEVLVPELGRHGSSPVEPGSPPESLPTPKPVLPESTPVSPSLPPAVDPSSKPKRRRLGDGLSPEKKKELLEVIRSSVIPEFGSSEGLDISQDPKILDQLPCGKGLGEIDEVDPDNALLSPGEPDPS